MTTSTPMLLLYTFVMAAVTYLIRMLPFVVFRKPIQNRFVRSFLPKSRRIFATDS